MLIRNPGTQIDRNINYRTGAVVVEAALVLPFLVVIMLGSIDIAQYINSAQLVANASREGARMASRFTTQTVEEVEAVVMDYLRESFPHLSDEELESASQTVLRDENNQQIQANGLAALQPGSLISVRVDFDFSSIRWVHGPEYSDGNINYMETFCRRE